MAIIVLCAVITAWRVSAFCWRTLKGFTRRSHPRSRLYFERLQDPNAPADRRSDYYCRRNAQSNEGLAQEEIRRHLQSEEVRRQLREKTRAQQERAQQEAKQHAMRLQAAKIEQQRLEDDRFYRRWQKDCDKAFKNRSIRIPLPPILKCEFTECQPAYRSRACPHATSRWLSSGGDFGCRKHEGMTRWHPDRSYFIEQGHQATAMATEVFQQLENAQAYPGYAMHAV